MGWILGMAAIAGCDCAGYASSDPDASADGDSDTDTSSESGSVSDLEPPPTGCLEAVGLTELSGPSQLAQKLQVASDGAGGFWVAWSDWFAVDSELIARRCEPGRGWLEQERLGVRDLEAFGAAPGTAFILSNTGGKEAQRWTEGTGWTGPDVLERESSVFGGERLSVAADGTAIAMWIAADGGSSVRSAVWRDGDWEDAADVEPLEEGEETRMPDVTASGDGEFLGVWTLCCDSLHWGRHVESWSPAERVDPVHGGQTGSPAIRSDSSGRGFAFWYGGDGAEEDAIRSARFDGESFAPSERLFDADGDTAYAAAVDASGTAFLVAGEAGNVVARRFDGAAWGSAETIETFDGEIDPPQWADAIAVATDGRGGAVAAWIQDHRVWANRFRDGAWTGPFEVADSDALDRTPVRVAVAPDGTALVSWVGDLLADMPGPEIVLAAVIEP